MRLVILESPYAGDVRANEIYARACLRDSLGRGEAPIASHLLYTQPGVLDDNDPHERQWGIDAGLAWRAVAEWSVVYEDLGVSSGMRYGIAAAEAAGLTVQRRTLPPEEMLRVRAEIEAGKDPAAEAARLTREAGEIADRMGASILDNDRSAFIRGVQFGIEGIPGADVSFSSVTLEDIGMTDHGSEATQLMLRQLSAHYDKAREHSVAAREFSATHIQEPGPTCEVEVDFDNEEGGERVPLTREDLPMMIRGVSVMPKRVEAGRLATYDLPRDVTEDEVAEALDGMPWCHFGFHIEAGDATTPDGP